MTGTAPSAFMSSMVYVQPFQTPFSCKSTPSLSILALVAGSGYFPIQDFLILAATVGIFSAASGIALESRQRVITVFDLEFISRQCSTESSISPWAASSAPYFIVKSLILTAQISPYYSAISLYPISTLASGNSI